MTADEATLRVLADTAGIAIPAEDLDPLRAALSTNLESAQVLAAVVLDDDEPIVDFDPHWR